MLLLCRRLSRRAPLALVPHTDTAETAAAACEWHVQCTRCVNSTLARSLYPRADAAATAALGGTAAASVASPVAVKVRPQVLADGTYATQTAAAEAAPAAIAANPLATHNLRTLFIAGDTFLGAVVAVTLVKLLLRLKAAAAATGAPIVKDIRRRSAETMLVLVAMLRFDEERAGASALALDKDSRDRIATCFMMLSNPSRDVVQCWLDAYRSSYAAMLEERRGRDIEEQDAKAAANACQPDDLIDFAHLKHRKGVAQVCPRCCWCVTTLRGPRRQPAGRRRQPEGNECVPRSVRNGIAWRGAHIYTSC